MADEPVLADVIPLVVPVERIAKRLGLDVPLDDTSEAIITDAILSAQAEVEGYLGRNITPMQFIQRGAIAYADGWHLSEPKVLTVDLVVPEVDPIDGSPTGRYTVTYTAGIDARSAQYGVIQRYVYNAALGDPEVARLWQAKQGAAAKRERNVSVEGQSISYDYLTPTGVERAGSGGGSAAPTLASMDRWRLAGRRVFQRPGRVVVDRALNG